MVLVMKFQGYNMHDTVANLSDFEVKVFQGEEFKTLKKFQNCIHLFFFLKKYVTYKNETVNEVA